MTRSTRILAVLAALLVPAAYADTDGHVYFGASFIHGDTTEVATDGYTFGFGGISRDGTLGWRWDLGFDIHDAREGNLGSLLVDDGDLTSTYFRFGPQWDFEGYESRFYIGLSAGYYWTYSNTTMYATVPGVICDPWWGWCYTVLVPGEIVLSHRNEQDWGYSATMGYEWDLIGSSLFIEAQYHVAAHGQGYEFMPVVLGFRF